MKRLFVCLLVFLHISVYAKYYSQYEQDKIVYERYFLNSTPGVFVDVGAHDGISLSNSYFFEKERGWTGICIEPMPHIFAKLQNNRKCICVQGCAAHKSGTGKLLMMSDPAVDMLSGLQENYDPRHLKRIQLEVAQSGAKTELIDVNCYRLNDLFESNNIRHINFLSIDTEGGEFDILSSIDFSKYKIDVIFVEDNYGDNRFIPFLTENGYVFEGKFAIDLLFISKEFKALQSKNSIDISKVSK